MHVGHLMLAQACGARIKSIIEVCLASCPIKFLIADIPNSHARIPRFKKGPALQELSQLLPAASSKLLVPVSFVSQLLLSCNLAQLVVAAVVPRLLLGSVSLDDYADLL